MELFLSLWIFVLGAMLGSVANAVVYRLPKGISWTKGRSMCPQCKHGLALADLIPLLSYLLLGGKCRYCKKPIGIRYFVVEAVMAAGFLLIFNFKFLIFNQFPNATIFNALILWGIWWVTVVITVMDWETQLVSEAMVAAWGGLVLILNFKFLIFNQLPISQLQNNLIGLVVAVALVGGIWALSRKRAMGFGDVEIAVVMGFWLGWPKIITGLWVAFVAGAAVGLVLLAQKKAKMKSAIAFGPFLILGSWVGYWWGEKLLHLIFNFKF